MKRLCFPLLVICVFTLHTQNIFAWSIQEEYKHINRAANFGDNKECRELKREYSKTLCACNPRQCPASFLACTAAALDSGDCSIPSGISITRRKNYKGPQQTPDESENPHSYQVSKALCESWHNNGSYNPDQLGDCRTTAQLCLGESEGLSGVLSLVRISRPKLDSQLRDRICFDVVKKAYKSASSIGAIGTKMKECIENLESEISAIMNGSPTHRLLHTCKSYNSNRQSSGESRSSSGHSN